MASVFPFPALRFASTAGGDVSAFIAPPYDVLDAEGKTKLLARSPDNIVGVDLPHTPAKALGPPEAYAAAGERFARLQSRHTLIRDGAPSMTVYRQSWTQVEGGTPRTLHRTGLACCIELLPFGTRSGLDGSRVLPHEETFSGPKLDRLALMRTTEAQLSPIFGLHADEHGQANAILKRVTSGRSPDQVAHTDDGTRHEVWCVHDLQTLDELQSVMRGEDVFIADGHHRYNTALNYLGELEARGPISDDHPARRIMMVLVGMSDPGLVIWPTHRVLGGMADYSWKLFTEAASDFLSLDQFNGGAGELHAALKQRDDLGPMRLGLLDARSGTGLLARPRVQDPLLTALSGRFASKPPAWRSLAVAFIQHVLVEQVCMPRLNSANPITWAFPHTLAEVQAICAGQETGAGGGNVFGPGGAQLAILVQPTPLAAVKDVSAAGVLMPQKSTFFYPKLATGLFIRDLRSRT